MRKKRKIFATAAVMVMPFSMASLAATYSDYWKQDANGTWYVQKPDGTKVVNAWLCDDAVPENGKEVWYLLDANGQMISAGLVQDGTEITTLSRQSITDTSECSAIRAETTAV